MLFYLKFRGIFYFTNANNTTLIYISHTYFKGFQFQSLKWYSLYWYEFDLKSRHWPLVSKPKTFSEYNSSTQTTLDIRHSIHRLFTQNGPFIQNICYQTERAIIQANLNTLIVWIGNRTRNASFHFVSSLINIQIHTLFDVHKIEIPLTNCHKLIGFQGT